MPASHLFVICLILVAFQSTAAERESVGVTVTIDTTKPGQPIDRNIYGQFSEHLGRGIYEGIWVGEDSPLPNIHGYRKDVVEALGRIHVPVIRWPGGCFADQYDWRDGIGPRDKRPVRVNVNWGGVAESNAFGTHEFLDLAEMLGADAYVTGNMGSMTPRDMAQWLEYMTSDTHSSLAEERRRNGRDKPWRVGYFGLGNESWGCGGMMRAEYASDVTNRYSYFLTAPAGQDLIKVASGPTGSFPGYEAFTETMMKNGKNFIFGEFNFQAISLHYYTNPPDSSQQTQALLRATGFGEDKWAVYLCAALRMEQLISTVSAIMDKYDPDKKVALYVDEWGAQHQPEPDTNPDFLYQQSTLLDAEVAALSLNIFQRHSDRVRMANIAQMINVVQALILTNGEKMILTPTYYVFDMYQPFRGGSPYPASISGPSYKYGDQATPAVDVSAVRGADGVIYLALVNLEPNKSADVITNLSGAADGQILTGPAMDAHNTLEAPDALRPIPFHGTNRSGKVTFHLPAKSVAVVSVK